MFRIDTEVIFIKYVVKENTYDFWRAEFMWWFYFLMEWNQYLFVFSQDI